ncbi:MAG: DUF2029 domain-containing protein [Rubrobacter sp.]|nr:DUF2029 domain-containing protein [Rubrobacter sp.]
MSLFSRLPVDQVEGSNDLQIYHSTGEALLRGGIPYRDFFIEYPPGSFVTFIPPALLSSDATEFASRFASEMALFLVASLILVTLCARKGSRLYVWPVPALVFTTGALMLYPVAVTRYDAATAFTLAGAAWCAALGGRYRFIGYAALGFGAAAKLIPALATLPLALIQTNRERGVIRDAAWGYGVFFAVVAAFFLPAYLLGGDDLMRSFAYHANRGLQVESLGASVMAVLNLVEDVRFEYGAFDVVGPGAGILSSLSFPITAFLLLITALFAYREHRLGRLDGARFPRYAAALILAFMLGSKVLSPQYVIWLLPLVPLAFGGFTSLGVCAVFLGVCWTTTQVYPHHYGDLLEGRSPGVELLLTRNFLLAALWAAMLFLPSQYREKVASP